MSEEFDALLRNGSWDIVSFDIHQKVVGCKWLFCIKRKPNDTVDRYKARLVSK